MNRIRFLGLTLCFSLMLTVSVLPVRSLALPSEENNSWEAGVSSESTASDGKLDLSLADTDHLSMDGGTESGGADVNTVLDRVYSAYGSAMYNNAKLILQTSQYRPYNSIWPIPNSGATKSSLTDNGATYNFGVSSKGCMAYGYYFSYRCYGDAGSGRSYACSAGRGSFNVDNLRSFITTHVQTGEQLRIWNAHSIVFLATTADGNGFYFSHYMNDTDGIRLAYTTYSNFANYCNNNGNGLRVYNVNTTPPAPAAPYLSINFPKFDCVTVGCFTNDAMTGLILERSENYNGPYTVIVDQSFPGDTFYKVYDNAPLPGKTLYYRAAAIIGGVKSEYSNIKSVSVPEPPNPGVTLNSVETSGSSIVLKWTNDNGQFCSGYDVERSDGNADNFKWYGSSQNMDITTFTDSSVNVGTRYYYRVRSYCQIPGGYTYGPWSEVKNLMLPSDPTVNLYALELTDSGFKLLWTPRSDCTGYDIYRSVDNADNFSYYDHTVNCTDSSYIDNNIDVGTVYYYKMLTYTETNGSYSHGPFSGVFSGLHVDNMSANIASASMLYGNNYYLLFDYGTSWHNANAAADKLGGHLVTITSEAENNAVHSFLAENSTGESCWLGGTDEADEGNWCWVTGEPFSYTKWNSGQPDDWQNEDYLSYAWANSDLWNDYPDSNQLRYIVEFEPVNSAELDGNTYTLYNISCAYGTAISLCEKMSDDSHPVTITSARENSFVYELRSRSDSTRNTWLGASSVNSEGMQWITGEPFIYTNWDVGQPDNDRGLESSVEMWNGGDKWNDCEPFDSKWHNLMVETEGVLPGDVNGDGKVSVSDAILVCRHIAGLSPLSGAGLRAAKICGHADVTIQDVVKICMRIAGKDK